MPDHRAQAREALWELLCGASQHNLPSSERARRELDTLIDHVVKAALDDFRDNRFPHPNPNTLTDILEAARVTGTFRLRSGQAATEYFDKYRISAEPWRLRLVAARMVDLLPTDTEVLAGLELGAVPIATAMSLASGLSLAVVRKVPKTYGTCQAVEGAEIANCKVVLVEDVITTGGAVASAAAHVRGAGGLVETVVCMMWRGDGEPHIADDASLAVVPLLRYRDMQASE